MTHPRPYLLISALLLASYGAASANAAATTGSETAQAASLVTYTEDRQPCADRSATRNAYFGDLHIHTTLSYDASPLGTRTLPADAYRFARGKPMPIPPYDANGEAQNIQQLATPLDFAAVTDHAEFFGETQLCSAPSSGGYESDLCQAIREGDSRGIFPLIQVLLSTEPQHPAEICGDSGAPCLEASLPFWQLTQDAAEDAYDRSERCEFTTFVGYEYTGTPNANNYHRNVLFRNSQVPKLAVSYVEAPTDRELWNSLRAQCLDGIAGCDVLAIPHNSNISAGSMFSSFGTGFASPGAAAEAADNRNAMEPLVEIFQHKGNSECFNGLPNILGAPDELCNIEQARSLGTMTDMRGQQHEVTFCAEGEVGTRGFSRVGCVSKNDFFRSVLLTGLQDEKKIGVNSYRMGVIASTDTHISLSGATDERSWPGHLGDELDLARRLTPSPSSPRNLDANPGGLAGVWAVENSRDALFDAMRRREVFGTSGTRIRPRLFGGWNIASDACERADRVAHGYANGTPMGGDFSVRPPGAKARLLATAVQDPDGAPLQRLQLIKGWIDAAGNSRYKVIDIAGEENTAGSVNLASGRWSGRGAASLCAVFEDPEFAPEQSAYYYLRAVEVPTLRWSWAQCVALSPDARPAECENDAPKTIQELAWTSPIWYQAP